MSATPRSASLLDTLADFFAQALGRPSFPLAENFFAAGGDSLAAAGILSRVDETFHVELKFRDILEAPTPLRFALTILRARAQAAGHDLATELSSLPSEDASRLLTYLQGASV